MAEPYPFLSVVIPARNEAQFIAQTVGYLLEQDYPSDKVEILVVVAESTDGTEELAESLAANEPRLKCFKNPYRLSSGARNIGIQAAQGEIILFIDGHVFIDNDQLFKNTVRLMKEKQVSVLSRPQFLDTPSNDHFQQAVSLARRSILGHGTQSTIYSLEEGYVDPSSSGASYRREVFEKIGYFDLSFDACEDVEFNHRCAKAGLRAFTSPRLTVYYFPRSSFGELFRQLVRYGKGRLRLAIKHPETFSLSTMAPSLLIAAPFLLAFASLAWPAAAYALAAYAVGYALILASFSIAISYRSGWSYLFVLPAVFSTIHAGLGWGFLHEAIRRLFSRHENTAVR